MSEAQSIKHATAGYCSGGEQQMVAIGRCLMGHPKIMLLDEPSMGLAPLLVREIADIVKRIHSEGKVSVLLVDQNARLHWNWPIWGMSSRTAGSSSMVGGEAQEQPDVKECYLGLDGLESEEVIVTSEHTETKKVVGLIR